MHSNSKLNNISEFKKKFGENDLEEVYQDAFCRFFSDKERKYILEKIYVEDEREMIYLYNSFNAVLNNPYKDQGGFVNYYAAEFNLKEKAFEVLRDHYPLSLLQFMKPFIQKKQKISKSLVLNFTQSLFTIIANVESGGLTLLGLKPGNIFINKDKDNVSLQLNGFIRSDKFLLSKPTYQSRNLQIFVQDCIQNKNYNIASRYQNTSHALCYAALIILIQFLLAADVNELGNIPKWLNGEESFSSSNFNVAEVLNQIEANFQGMRLFLEQAQIMLMDEEQFCNRTLAMQLMTFASELKIENNIILLGDILPEKVIQNDNVAISQQEIKQQQIQKQKPKSKRTGGGFVLPKNNKK